ncbi:acyl-CoA dehydrogenase family protein [Reyranella sp.]|uniref:acyl-CoA dehydrogenase family protein n=1 Tax=Reyranella sp. TaxID=1929291 RepID=UPI0012191D82|nr:acyl-CoA dehydrogenase family protein [Reyranella sp.]TAJ89319.1 MAG: acyl-CoA dehydrogenase [Reyranella sp.]
MNVSEGASKLRAAVDTFFNEEVLPRHRDWAAHVARHPGSPPFLAGLRARARERGLWNLWQPDRLSNRDYAPIAEITGRLPWASEVFNGQAPDVPNMIMLQHAATPAQKQRWLEPLLEGRIRSAFGMTEPDVASSDATNIATSLRRDGGEWVVNGRKWYITGGAHPDCAFVIVMGVSRPEASRTGRHSCVIVPMETPGLKVVRELRFLGWEDSIAPIAELEFRDVRVPLENLLGEEGEGFAAAQVRLGPARLHHCMRAIGTCEVLVELMMARAAERSTFGRTVIDYDATQHAIARSRIEINQARLLVLHTAERLDADGHHAAWRDVSMVKVAVPEMAQRVADRALQLFGAMGGSDDAPIHRAFAVARMLRIADGPDEVHLRQIFRAEPPARWRVADSPYITPGA